MKRRRDITILLALFVLLVAFTILGPGSTQQEDTAGNRPTTHSSTPDGALALWRWLDDLGYDARRLQYTDFELTEQTAALFILNPSVPFNRTAAREVITWVEDGGTLILVDDRSQLFAPGNALLESLDIELQPYTSETGDTFLEEAAVLQPVLNDPPLREITLRTGRVLETARDDVAHLVGSGEHTALMGIQQGTGYIYVSSASFPFTNEGLREEQSAALLLNLLRRVPPGSRVLFDEYHHGFFTPPSLRSVILSNAWGWALIYLLAVLALYLLLTGRRFGQPVPLREELARRSSAEYVESMADMFQRGKKRGFVLRHYHTAFKRRLAKPYGINPRLEDELFVAELARYQPVDQTTLLALLQRLRQQHISEDDLLRVVHEADSAEIRK